MGSSRKDGAGAIASGRPASCGRNDWRTALKSISRASPAYWSVNRARMAVTDQGGSRTLFTFERRGPFEWKLVHIGLPDGTAPAAAAVTVTPR